jgi:hypothetical protein
VRAKRPANNQGEADACNRTEEKQGVLSHLASLLVGTSRSDRASWRPYMGYPV